MMPNIELNTHIKDQIEKFINAGQYRLVLKAVKVLEFETSRNKFPDLTSSTLLYCHSEEFMSLFIKSLRIVRRKKSAAAFLLCDYIGEQIISPLMDALNDEELEPIRGFIIKLIIYFGDKAIPEAMKRLDDNRWFVKRNMLYILFKCGNKNILEKVKPYCNHKNPKVSFEATRCLLKAKSSHATEILQKSLRAKNRNEVMGAISLSGLFKVKGVVPDLIQMLERRAITGMDFFVKTQLIRALGQIGDSRAINTLRGIISSKPLLFKSSFETLKDEVSISLKSYPSEEVKDLMNYSKDSACALRNQTKRKTQKKWLYVPIAAIITGVFVAELYFLLNTNKFSQRPTSFVTKGMKTNSPNTNQYGKIIEDLSAEEWFDKGLTLDKAKRYKQSVDAYKQAIKIKPDYAEAHYSLSLSYLMLDDRDSALKEYEILKKLYDQKANTLYMEINPIASSGKDTVQKQAESNINTTNKIINKTLIDNEHEVYRTIYTIQTGSFKNETYAQGQFNSLMKLLDKKELDYLRIERINTFNVVRLGKFEGYSTAVKLIKEIKPHISNAFILEAYIKNEA